jgi:plastocyanin
MTNSVVVALSDNKLVFLSVAANANADVRYVEPTPGQWTHVAIVNDAGTQTVWYNGVEQTKVSGTFGTASYTNGTAPLRIGRLGPANGGTLNGKMAMVRISNTAKYAAAFVPVITYGVNADTLLFLSSDTPLVDSGMMFLTVTNNGTTQSTDFPTPSTYTITAVGSVNSGTSVDEGSNATFEVGGTNIADGTYYWTIETNASDFATASGLFSITSSSGSFSVVPTADTTTEGEQTFTVALRLDSTTGTTLVISDPFTINDTSLTPAPTYTITPDANNVDEGWPLGVVIGGTNIPNGTYYWTVTNSGDFGTASGEFNITDNVGVFEFTPTTDNTTEGAETFTISVRSGSITGDILVTSDTITINDTSTTPAFSPDYTITVTNSGNSYRISGSDRTGGYTDATQPALVFNNGDKVRFNVNAGTASAHPFYIKTTQSSGTGNQVSAVSGQGTTTLEWTTSDTGVGSYGYQCSIHVGMWNTITIA